MSAKLVESADPTVKAGASAADEARFDAVHALLDVAAKRLLLREVYHELQEPAADAYFDKYYEEMCELDEVLVDAAHDLTAADDAFCAALEGLYEPGDSGEPECPVCNQEDAIDAILAASKLLSDARVAGHKSTALEHNLWHAALRAAALGGFREADEHASAGAS